MHDRAELLRTAREADVRGVVLDHVGTPRDRRLARRLLHRHHRRRTRDPELDRRVAERRIEDEVREEQRVPRTTREEPIEENRRLAQVSPRRSKPERGARRGEASGIETRIVEREPAGREGQEGDPIDPTADRGARHVGHGDRRHLAAEDRGA